MNTRDEILVAIGRSLLAASQITLSPMQIRTFLVLLEPK